MPFRISHEFSVIGKESTGFSKNYYYEWDDGLGGHPSQLFLNFQIKTLDVPGNEIGELIFETMKNYFYHDLEREGAGRFEDMLKEVNLVISKKEEELGVQFVSDLNVIAASIWDDALYLSQYGEGEAYLVRRRFVSTISEGLSDPKQSKELFSNIASGEFSAGDYLLLCSSRLVRYITKTDLGRLLSEEADLHKALKTIDDAVSLDLMDRMTILGVQIGEETLDVIVGEDGDSMVARKKKTKWAPKLGASLKLHFGKLVPKKVQNKKEVGKQTKKIHSRAQDLLDSVDDEDDGFVEEMDQGRDFDYQDDIQEESMDLQELPHEDEHPETAHHEAAPKKESKHTKARSDFSDLVSEWKELKRDKILMALVAVVLVLVVGIYVVRNQGQKQQYIEELEGQLELVELNINTAKTTGSYDKDSATELLDEAEEIALEVLNTGYLRGKASEYLSDIEQQRDFLDNVQRVESPTIFADFSLTNPGMNALGMVEFGDTFYVYEHDKMYQIILDEIQEPIVIDEDEVVVDAFYFEEEEAILFLTKSNRIIQYQDGQFTFLDTDDGAWHAATDIYVYNSRIYLLDSSEGEIWRYYRQRDGYSGADAYLTDESLDISGAVSLAIDGEVYVLQDDGTLEKLLSGADSGFSVKKAPTTDLSGATVIYTEFEMFQAFILDPSKSRVLVYNKDARTGNLVYSAQYVLDVQEELRNILVDKEASRMYVVGESSVYEVQY
jgi:hypothetical protein